MTMPATIGKVADKLVRGSSRRLSRIVPFRPVQHKFSEPIISFTFDDFPRSAAEAAAPILEDAGMRGTFYYAGGLAGRLENGQEIATPETVSSLFSRGHEIGAHTHNHLDVHRTPSDVLIADIEHNKQEIARLTDGRMPTSFAYPYGKLDLRSKFVLRHQFVGLRGIQTGLNRGVMDLAHLKAQELYDCSSTLASMSEMLDQAEQNRAWVIFYTHDVRLDPTNIGCSPAYFRDVVGHVRRRNLKVETVADVLARITS